MRMRLRRPAPPPPPRFEMDLTPVSELSSTAEYEEECDMLGIISSSERGHYKKKQEEPNIQRSKQQLESENEELRRMCGYLDEAHRKSKRLVAEVQSFGNYTAEVLREEIANSESKEQVMKEQLERLIKENKELKEMCLFLDRSQDGSAENSLTPPETVELMVHAQIVGEMNKHQGRIPRYMGLTKGSTLKDRQAIRKGVELGIGREVALEEMKKRLDRLEAERLELIKSLSAAHILAIEANDVGLHRSEEDPTHDTTLPLNLRKHLSSIRKARLNESSGEQKSSSGGQRSRESSLSGNGDDPKILVPPHMIMNAVTLLDVVRRLDAATVGGFSDGLAEGEATALRLLVNIAWQKMQEKHNNP